MSKIACSIASLSLMVFFFACKKEESRPLITDSSTVNKSETGINLKQAAKKCRVVSIIEPVGSYRADTAVFEYNKWGDPVSVVHYPWPKTGSPNLFFSYDNKHRLTEARGMYRDNDGEWYKKYFFSGPGGKQAIMDSTYVFPVFQNGVLTWYYNSYATWIFNDSQGRVIKDSLVDSRWPPVISHYSYDANGNRTGPFNYDNKVNPHVTNEIFQFIDRDYSVNNPFVAETYNLEGLPTTLNISFSVSAPYLHLPGTPGIRNATITYDCK
jgi:hypothetical protein